MTTAAPAALTAEQLGVLARAVSRAPSVHNSQPWQLLVRGTEVDLLERREVALRRHDPSGRDRLLSCGAAATNLELVRRDTPVPDDVVPASRLAAENILLLCTETDTRADHLAAGAALQRVWLTATVKALAGSVLTRPLHLTGFRARLVSELTLPGVPQAIFRFGHPAVPATPSPRLPLGELLPPPGGIR